MTKFCFISPLQQIVFDLDGTLLDSRELAVNAVQAACIEAFKNFDISDSAPLEEQVLDCVGLPAPDFFDKLLREYSPSLRRCAEKYCERIEAEYIRDGRMKLYPDILDTLKLLTEKGLVLTVASNCAPDYLKESLLHCGLTPLISEALCPGLRSGADKGSLLVELVERFGKNAIMVGDRRSDFEAAAKASIPFWGCSYGFGDMSELEGAERIIDALGKIPSILKASSETK